MSATPSEIDNPQSEGDRTLSIDLQLTSLSNSQYCVVTEESQSVAVYNVYDNPPQTPYDNPYIDEDEEEAEGILNEKRKSFHKSGTVSFEPQKFGMLEEGECHGKQRSPLKKSLTKHEQRKLNLKLKRAREQIMQVVEGYIRDQTIIAAYQSYMEANFLNDMMNVSNQIIENSVQSHIRDVIQEILREIYVASTASIMLENVVVKELKAVCSVCLDSETKELQLQAQDDSNSIFERLIGSFLKKMVCSIENEATNDVIVDSIKDQIVEEKVNQEVIVVCLDEVIGQKIEKDLISKLVDSELILLDVRNNTIDSLLQTQTNTVISESIVEQMPIDILLSNALDDLLITNDIYHSYLSKILNELVQESIADTLQETLSRDIIEKVQTEMIQNELAQYLLFDEIEKSTIFGLIVEIFHEINSDICNKQEQMTVAFCDKLFEDNLPSLIAQIFREQVELEYYSSNISNKFLNSCIVSEISHFYKEEQAKSKMFDIMIKQYIEEILKSEIKNHKQIAYEIPNDVQDKVIENTVLNEVYSVAYSSLMGYNSECLLEQIMNEVISNTLNEQSESALILDEIFDDYLSTIIFKEIKFEIQLQKDSEQIAQQLFNSCIVGRVSETFLPLAIQDQTVQQVMKSESKNVYNEMVICSSQTDDILEELTYQMILEIFIETNQEEQQYVQQQSSINSSQYKRQQKQPKNVQTIQINELNPKCKSTSHSDLSVVPNNLNFEKALKLSHQSLLSGFLHKFLFEIINSLVLKLIAEHIYKKIMHKVLKRNIYGVIQQSVDTMYALEEDTITNANKVLDTFILSTFDEIVQEELILNKNSEDIFEDMADVVVYQEVFEIVYTTMNEIQSQKYQLLLREGQQCEDVSKIKVKKRISDLIRIDIDESDQQSNEDHDDADIFSDQDEKNSIILISPSKQPDFRRNVLSSSKSLKNSISKYNNIVQSQQKKQIKAQNENRKYHQRMPSEIEQKAMKFALHQQQQAQNLRKSAGDFKLNKENIGSPTARYYVQQIQINQEIESVEKQSFGGGTSSSETEFLSAANTFKDFKFMRKRNSSDADGYIFGSETVQDFLAYRNNKNILKEHCRPTQQQSIVQQKRKQSIGCSSTGSQDELCTLRSDDDEDKVVQTYHIYKQSEGAYENNHKRIPQVIARQPKEGINFIEKKNSNMSSLQQLDLNQYSSNHNYYIDTQQNMKNSFLMKRNLTVPTTQGCCETNQDSNTNDQENSFNKYLQPGQAFSQQPMHHRGDSSSDCVNFNSELLNPLSPDGSLIRAKPQHPSSSSIISTPHNTNTNEKKLDEGQLNKQIEKLQLQIGQKCIEIKRTNSKSLQIKYLQLLMNLGLQILNATTQKIEMLFEIDQQLKEIILTLSSDQKNQQEYFQVILFTNQIALLNYQKVSCLVDKKSAHPIIQLQQSSNSLHQPFIKESSSVTSFPKKQSHDVVSTTKQSFKRLFDARLNNKQNNNGSNNNNKQVGVNKSHVQKGAQSSTNLKNTSYNYFSNTTTGSNTTYSNNQNKSQSFVEPMDLTIFKAKDQQYILRSIGKIEGQGLIPNRQENVSCAEFQKRQFYLMTLYNVMRKRIRGIGKESISIEDMFNKMKCEKVHQRDWKEYIERSLKYLESN